MKRLTKYLSHRHLYRLLVCQCYHVAVFVRVHSDRCAQLIKFISPRYGFVNILLLRLIFCQLLDLGTTVVFKLARPLPTTP